MADIITNTLQIGSDNLILRDADAQARITTLEADTSTLKEETSDLKSVLTSRTENIFDYYSLIEGSYTDSSGNIVSRAGCYRTDYIPVEGGATYARYTPDATSSNYYYAFYNSSKQFISRYNIRYSHTYEFPATAAYVIISSYDVPFQESFTIVKSNERIYYSAPYYQLNNKSLYGNFDDTLTQSGMIADAKATGDKFDFIFIDTPNLYDYTKNEENKFYDASGNYTSDAGSYLSDFIPVESGESYSYYGNSALYLNTFNSDKTWQARTKADSSSVTIGSGISYVRFGMYKQNFVDGFMFVHGSMPDNDYPYTKMINPVLIPPEDETDDDGLIDVEGHTGYFYHYHKTKSGKYLRYKFNHFVDASSNADGWVQRDVKLVNSLKSQELMKVVYDGEWEMAIQIHSAPDFIGCQNHGSEVSTIVNMYVDGIKTTISDGDSFSCKEIKVNQKSTMYDPSDETTIVGYHYRSHIITKNSIKIEQRIEWVRDVTTDKSYVLMMPAIRGNDSVSVAQITDHAYDNWNYTESDVSTTTFNPSSIGNQTYRGNKFSLYGATSKISIESVCDIKERPASSFAYLSNASYYNKWYCAYCGDNFSVSNGDKWEWVSEYHITYDGN